MLSGRYDSARKNDSGKVSQSQMSLEKKVPDPWARSVTRYLLVRQLQDRRTTKQRYLCTPCPAQTRMACSTIWEILYQGKWRGLGWGSVVTTDKKILRPVPPGGKKWRKAGRSLESNEWCGGWWEMHLPIYFKALHLPPDTWGPLWLDLLLQAPWGQRADQLILNQKTGRDIDLLHWGKSQTLWVISSDDAFLGLMQERMCLDGYINHLHSKLVWKLNFMCGADMKSIGVTKSLIAKRLKALETHGRSFPFWISISNSDFYFQFLRGFEKHQNFWMAVSRIYFFWLYTIGLNLFRNKDGYKPISAFQAGFFSKTKVSKWCC